MNKGSEQLRGFIREGVSINKTLLDYDYYLCNKCNISQDYILILNEYWKLKQKLELNERYTEFLTHIIEGYNSLLTNIRGE